MDYHSAKDTKGKIFLSSLVLSPALNYRDPLSSYLSGRPRLCRGIRLRSITLGLLPIIMAWVGRYRLKFPGQPQLPGGKILLSLMALFVIIEMVRRMQAGSDQALFLTGQSS